MKVGNNIWADEALVERLKHLWESGLSASQIAAELGNVSRNAVIGKVHRLGLAGRKKGPVPGKRRFNPEPLVQPSRRLRALQQAIAQATSVTHAAHLDAAAEFDPSAISVSDAEIPVELRVSSILHLRDRDCRFPIGEVGTEGFYFCGRGGGGKLDGLPYCARHARVAYQPPSERRRPREISEEERTRRSTRMKQMHAKRRAEV